MNSIDTSSELEIYHYEDGFILVSPKTNKHIISLGKSTGLRVADALEYQLFFTILNRDCQVQVLNELSASATGYKSIKSALGKTVADVVIPQSACHILNHNQEVMSLKQRRFFSEEVIRKDDSVFSYLTIKSPLYGDQGKVIGLLGCGFSQNTSKDQKTLSQLHQLGFLNLPSIQYNLKFFMPENNKYHLSKQELQVLYYAVKGHSAKMTAKILKLSPRTVEHYLNSVKTKTHTSSKRELIDRALTESIL